MKRGLIGLAGALLMVSAAGSVSAAEVTLAPARQWSFSGLFGTFDRAAVQRGLEVYRQVCASCHSLELVHFRNLTGIGLSEEHVEELAAAYEVEDGPNDEGDMFMRPGKAFDRFPSPYANEQAARAANAGAWPPDLSLITKARAGESVFRGTKFRPYGADYVHALLTGYEEEPPAGVELMEGMYYNEYFPGRQIAMAPPLYEGAVEYADGTEASVDQLADDLATFLSWAADPNMEERKRLGVMVLLFTIVLTAMLYAVKKRIWSDIH